MRTFILILGLLSSSLSFAQSNSVYKNSADVDFETAYKQVYKELEQARFFVVFEAYISKNLARFEQRWGDDYNKNKLEQIRSMVFCNIYYVNQVANLDTDMLSLCPLRLTMIHKQGKTTVLFNRPSHAAAKSPALKVIEELETSVIEAIDKGLQPVSGSVD